MDLSRLFFVAYLDRCRFCIKNAHLLRLGSQVSIRHSLFIFGNSVGSYRNACKLCFSVLVGNSGKSDLSARIRCSWKYKLNAFKISHSLCSLADLDHSGFLCVVNIHICGFCFINRNFFRIGNHVCDRNSISVFRYSVSSRRYSRKISDSVFVGNSRKLDLMPRIRRSRKDQRYTLNIHHAFGFLMNLYCSHCVWIVHNNISNASVWIYRKLYVGCKCITAWSSRFPERVGFSGDQNTLNAVRIFGRYPFVNYVSVLINYLKNSSRKLIIACDVFLWNFNLCGFVSHYDQRQTVIWYRSYFGVISEYFTVFIDSNSNIGSYAVAAWSIVFMQSVASCGKSCNDMLCSVRRPLFNSAACFVNKLHLRAADFFSVCVLLWNC